MVRLCAVTRSAIRRALFVIAQVRSNEGEVMGCTFPMTVLARTLTKAGVSFFDKCDARACEVFHAEARSSWEVSNNRGGRVLGRTYRTYTRNVCMPNYLKTVIVWCAL